MQARSAVFFALWPTPQIAAALAALTAPIAAALGVRATPAEKIHITLAYLGEQPEARVADLIAIARTLCLPDGSMQLDELNHWRGPRIVWAGAQQTPAMLADFVVALRSRLELGGFATDAREFVPHATLLRAPKMSPQRFHKAVRNAPIVPPLVWPIGDFQLMESTPGPTGSVYRLIWRSEKNGGMTPPV